MQQVANMTASSPASGSPSTRKPRLLWRGVLHLQDGTALPGLAIVSSMQPGFPRFQNQDHPTTPPPDDASPFTLSKEQQDALSLSIEMVRHAPLMLLEVVENTELDGNGLLCLPRSESGDPERSAAPANDVHITFEAAGDVRLYIDPAHYPTVAFFERLFAYDGSSDDRSGKQSEGTTSRKITKTAVVFSLDKSLIGADKAAAEAAELFADPSWHATQKGSSQTSGAMEAVVIGIRRPTGSVGETVELHVGKKIARRMLSRTASTANARMMSSSKDSQALLPPESANGAPAPRGLRPDDPAPRGFARATSHSSSSFRSFSSSSLPVMMPNRALSTAEFVIPPPPSLVRRQNDAGRMRKRGMNDDSDSGSHSMPSSEPSMMQTDEAGTRESTHAPEPSLSASDPRKKRGSTHAPGRRGTKKSRRADDASTETFDQSMMSAIEDDEVDAAPTKKTASFEERNRSMIKKLVHYQLLGKGVERQEPTYAACFGPTCQGTLLALRSIAKEQLIDRQVAASIVERHLDMYL